MELFLEIFVYLSLFLFLSLISIGCIYYIISFVLSSLEIIKDYKK